MVKGQGNFYQEQRDAMKEMVKLVDKKIIEEGGGINVAKLKLEILSCYAIGKKWYDEAIASFLDAYPGLTLEGVVLKLKTSEKALKQVDKVVDGKKNG